MAPSSSLRFLEILTLTLWGRLRTPCDQMNWLSLGSILTSSVFMSFATRFLMAVKALGAFFLNWVRWASLCTLMVVSMAVSVSPLLCSFFTITQLIIKIINIPFSLALISIQTIIMSSISPSPPAPSRNPRISSRSP